MRPKTPCLLADRLTRTVCSGVLPRDGRAARVEYLRLGSAAGLHAISRQRPRKHDRRLASPRADGRRPPGAIAGIDDRVELHDECAEPRGASPTDELGGLRDDGHLHALRGLEPRAAQDERVFVQHPQRGLCRLGRRREWRYQDTEQCKYERDPPHTASMPPPGGPGSSPNKILTSTRAARRPANHSDAGCNHSPGMSVSRRLAGETRSHRFLRRMPSGVRVRLVEAATQ